jgi:ADP-ribose pyrophosphatase YjhB (NUDIX family)
MEGRDWFKDPPPRRVGVLALLERGTEILLIRRTYWTAVSEWGLPGGSAAANELPRRALSRLLAEKVGLRATAGALVAVDHSPEWPGHFHEGVNYVYQVPPGDGEVAVSENSGYAEARWVERSQVASLAVDHELLRIEQCLRAAEAGTVVELLAGLDQHGGRAALPGT